MDVYGRKSRMTSMVPSTKVVLFIYAVRVNETRHVLSRTRIRITVGISGRTCIPTCYNAFSAGGIWVRDNTLGVFSASRRLHARCRITEPKGELEDIEP